jgi:hypothetical protein
MFEPYEDEAQARANMIDIMEQHLAADVDSRTSEELADLKLVDVLVSYRDNLWDDQHEGGAHKDHLLAVNQLFIWLGVPDQCDPYEMWAALPADELQDTDAWWVQQREAEKLWHDNNKEN